MCRFENINFCCRRRGEREEVNEGSELTKANDDLLVLRACGTRERAQDVVRGGHEWVTFQVLRSARDRDEEEERERKGPRALEPLPSGVLLKEKVRDRSSVDIALRHPASFVSRSSKQ